MIEIELGDLNNPSPVNGVASNKGYQKGKNVDHRDIRIAEFEDDEDDVKPQMKGYSPNHHNRN